ncbi:MAG: MBL fold metallo-hydrolase [Caulobacteraceae bacterium]|nr:MBL fold metallo-hydrolase [Caulobacteraceae bacterium]
MSQAWHVNSRCINCMASRTMAPALIKEVGNRSVFVRQPATAEEETAAWRALQVCPTAAVEAPSYLAKPRDLFPQDLGEGVFRLGYNAKSSYGAHSYFGVVDDVRFMVDAPRWSAHLASWIDGKDGLDHILLTHRDDVADAARYAKHFGARVWIHEADADSAPFATDVMRGGNPPAPFPAMKVLGVPGHTRGSVMYLLNDHTLFTGDSLAWDPERDALNGHREFCWHDWATQLASLSKLREQTFSRVLAGHGGSITLSPERMRAELEAMLAAS